MDTNRAESFLKLIKQSQRGKLKIYLGYCAGVGKTYLMLQEARRLKSSNIDIVAGIVETHGRKETQALLDGIEVIPRKSSEYHGIEISEMDLDAILERKPEVVLVDELAHTNVPGSKNAKRYEDIEEIMAAGIHVISTLNVQHIESLYETVEHATSVRVRERVPDRIIAMADQLVNVDITADDLRQRLLEGKVYYPGKIETALDNFFRQENLEQLRELALRELAAQIDSKRRIPRLDDTLSIPDQLMVCLSSKTVNSEAILRYASRIAGRLNRNWYAVYVQMLADNPVLIDAGVQRAMSRTLTLAQELGATVFTYKGDDIVRTILQFAKEYRVGNIIIGNSGRTLPFWARLTGKRTIIERLIDESRGERITVLDVREEETAKMAKAPAQYLSDITESLLQKNKQRKEWKEPIRKARVVLWENLVEKEEAISRLVHECCAANPSLDEKYVAATVFEREKQGSTFIGEDIAIPHAKLEKLKSPIVATGVSKIGIFDDESANSARIMFMILSPKDEPNIHIRLLGTISRMGSDSHWRSMMLRAANAGDIQKLIRRYINQM
ncbi:MAG: PTS transporter subunit EIIA [Chlorobiaceae bacterium]|nr:PTS transporter subunit EIIA [Chlorobiaceae bacterium]NTW09730.1 PTS transporter subunit EIIA [Chlorobiaceae bacterium]